MNNAPLTLAWNIKESKALWIQYKNFNTQNSNFQFENINYSNYKFNIIHVPAANFIFKVRFPVFKVSLKHNVQVVSVYPASIPIHFYDRRSEVNKKRKLFTHKISWMFPHLSQPLYNLRLFQTVLQSCRKVLSTVWSILRQQKSNFFSSFLL